MFEVRIMQWLHVGALRGFEGTVISLFHRWNYTAKTDETAIVLPDGCCDILVVSQPDNGPDVLRLTDWDAAPKSVKISAGSSITGYRLRPGTTVTFSQIEKTAPDLSNLGQQIEDAIVQDQESTEIIAALSRPNETVERAARQQGVTPRTLQRHFKTLSLPSPGFWRLLGRARAAAQALPCRVPLCDIAFEYGFSDQAHMTREFVRWFGQTPVNLRRNPAAMSDLAQPGLGNWSGDEGLNPAGLC